MVMAERVKREMQGAECKDNVFGIIKMQQNAETKKQWASLGKTSVL